MPAYVDKHMTNVCVCVQAYGMSALPLSLIKGSRSVLYERLENTEDLEEVEQQIDKLRAKVAVSLCLCLSLSVCLCLSLSLSIYIYIYI